MAVIPGVYGIEFIRFGAKVSPDSHSILFDHLQRRNRR